MEEYRLTFTQGPYGNYTYQFFLIISLAEYKREQRCVCVWAFSGYFLCVDKFWLCSIPAECSFHCFSFFFFFLATVFWLSMDRTMQNLLFVVHLNHFIGNISVVRSFCQVSIIPHTTASSFTDAETLFWMQPSECIPFGFSHHIIIHDTVDPESYQRCSSSRRCGPCYLHIRDARYVRTCVRTLHARWNMVTCINYIVKPVDPFFSHWLVARRSIN